MLPGERAAQCQHLGEEVRAHRVDALLGRDTEPRLLRELLDEPADEEGATDQREEEEEGNDPRLLEPESHYAGVFTSPRKMDSTLIKPAS